MNKTLQGANLVPHPLNRQDALLILSLTESEAEPVEAEAIMRRYYQLFLKNNPAEGGSFYIQAKVFHSKEILMQDFKDQEAEIVKLLDEEYEVYKTEKPEEPKKEEVKKTARVEAEKEVKEESNVSKEEGNKKEKEEEVEGKK